jgi:hypothetical protein
VFPFIVRILRILLISIRRGWLGLSSLMLITQGRLGEEWSCRK